MDKIEWLEATYARWMEEIGPIYHELLWIVDQGLIEQLGLGPDLDFEDLALDRQFHVIQSADKMMMYNEKFVVWIVPANIEGESATYVWIARTDHIASGFSMGFVARGKFNSSKIVLRILERFLEEIEESETLIRSLKKEAKND